MKKYLLVACCAFAVSGGSEATFAQLAGESDEKPTVHAPAHAQSQPKTAKRREEIGVANPGEVDAPADPPSAKVPEDTDEREKAKAKAKRDLIAALEKLLELLKK